jgi:dUTP pyrophosphatase
MKLEIRRLDPGLPIPVYARSGDAGLDLLSAESIELKPGRRAVIGTGVAVAIPHGYAGFVHARSGRAANEGLALVNAPGVIDSGYRGEIKVIAVNLDPDETIHIERGQKIAQLVVQPVVEVEPVEASELGGSERGDAGFGSTGS